MIQGNYLQNPLKCVQTGLLPVTVKSLSEHSTLSQQALDIRILYAALQSLSKCEADFQHLSRLVEEGRLPQAVASCQALQRSLGSAPDPLSRTVVMADLKVCESC